MLFQSKHIYHEHFNPLEKTWIKYEDIPDNVRFAVVSCEDVAFFYHHGFNVWEQRRALADYLQKKRGSLRGASTISQQAAKNVFLSPRRNLIRKIREAYYTFLIEKIWGKERILEVYVNVIESAPNLYGMAAAAEYYFKKDISQLTDLESMMIASVFPNPRELNVKILENDFAFEKKCADNFFYKKILNLQSMGVEE